MKRITVARIIAVLAMLGAMALYFLKVTDASLNSFLMVTILVFFWIFSPSDKS